MCSRRDKSPHRIGLVKRIEMDVLNFAVPSEAAAGDYVLHLIEATLQPQEPGLYFPFALDFYSAARLENELVLKPLVDGPRHLNRVGNAT